jgi:CubicO group peptidase (beta-lactamase class C family)
MRALDQPRRWGAPTWSAGVADAEGALATAGDAGHRFALASVTKLLTALAVLVAVEEGTVDLDEPAGPPGATVRHLLAHTAGYGFDGAAVLTPPGRRRIYSNTGYEVLARHVAGAAAMPFDRYLAEAVLGPLGLAGTTLDGSPAAGATAPLGDVLRLGTELLAPSIVAPATLAEATTVQFPGLAGVVPGIGRMDPCDWGLGPELKDAKAPHWTPTTASAATFGHFGAAGTFLWVDPVAGVACAALTDRPFGPWALEAWPAFGDAVLAEVGASGTVPR